jgi:roadblock/LC7 domain-containing protein
VLKRLLLLDGVNAVCHFRDDGALDEGYGMLDDAGMTRLARFALEYKRLVQANADQLSMFTQMRGWTPPRGWIVRGERMTVCSVGNLVCLVENEAGQLTEIMRELEESSHW